MIYMYMGVECTSFNIYTNDYTQNTRALVGVKEPRNYIASFRMNFASRVYL